MSRRAPSKISSREQVSRKSSATKTPASRKPLCTSTASKCTSKASLKASASTVSAQVEEKPKKEWTLPALSVAYKPKLTESEFQKMKKKTMRRHAPPGEDIKCIKEILRTLKKKNVTVQEFISLIGPSTADKGVTLRNVMQEDVNAFRVLARKVYDTVTQDSSDVLLNQQLQLSEYYKQKRLLLHDKMMRHIGEIYAMIPNFDFAAYGKEKEKYLEKKLPIPTEVIVPPEEMDMLKRQAAYHRLQWLRSEGERLNEENNSLKKRLTQLKRMHKEEQMRMVEKERQAEDKKEELEATEAQKAHTLQQLNQSLEKTIIDREREIREDEDKIMFEIQPGKTAQSKRKKKKRPAWNEESALEVETKLLNESRMGDIANISKAKVSAQRETSPFHYSPPRSPPAQAQYVSPPRIQQAPVEEEASKRFSRRSSLAPRDSWGGFY